ncbi:MAG: ferredoxin reductase family protein [Candidatus Woesearchaeota archaeon]|jgi:predicted ferric reductase
MVRLTKRFDIIIVVLFVLITLTIWGFMMPLTERFFDYGTSMHSLGQITGLIGTVLFALSLLLTTKLKFVENTSSGLDKTYKLHHIIGAISFMVLLFHPILLVVKFIPDNWALAATYLWPSSSWAVNFGIISLVSMIVLLVLTFYVKLNYKSWKISHTYLGWAFVIACLHIFLITTDISRSNLLKAWMIFVCAIGLLSFFYGSYFKNLLKKQFKYSVEDVKKSGPFTTIIMKPKNKEMKYKAGQFIFVKFDAEDFKESHPFTIASAPNNKKEIRLVIKSLGDYTSKINELPKGATATIDGPYGKFNFMKENKDQIWIAGGVGVTPFLSFAQSLNDNNKFKKKIDMYYCTRDEKEQIYADELKSVANKNKNFNLIEFCASTKGQINAELIDKTLKIKDKAIFLCGPPQMMNSLKSQFLKAGVKKRNIFMEDFGFK